MVGDVLFDSEGQEDISLVGVNDPERIVELVDLANSKLTISSEDKPRNGDNNGHNDKEITCSKC